MNEAVNETELITTSVNELIQREKHTNLFKQKLANILSIPMTEDMYERFANNGLNIQNGNMADAISASMVIQALAGNTTAYATIRDTMGFKPVDQVKSDVVVHIDMSPQAKALGE